MPELPLEIWQLVCEEVRNQMEGVYSRAEERDLCAVARVNLTLNTAASQALYRVPRVSNIEQFLEASDYRPIEEARGQRYPKQHWLAPITSIEIARGEWWRIINASSDLERRLLSASPALQRVSIYGSRRYNLKAPTSFGDLHNQWLSANNALPFAHFCADETCSLADSGKSIPSVPFDPSHIATYSIHRPRTSAFPGSLFSLEYEPPCTLFSRELDRASSASIYRFTYKAPFLIDFHMRYMAQSSLEETTSMAVDLIRRRIGRVISDWFEANWDDMAEPCPRFEIYGALGVNDPFRTLIGVGTETMSRVIKQMETKLNEEVYEVPGKGVTSMKFFPLDQAPKCPACGK